MSKSERKLTDYLDQQAGKLASDHEQRLKQMTHDAIRQQQAQARYSYWPWPVVSGVVASGVLLFISMGWWFGEPSLNQSLPQAQGFFPALVMDDQVPLALLEEMSFYQWLAGQPEVLSQQQDIFFPKYQQGLLAMSEQ